MRALLARALVPAALAALAGALGCSGDPGEADIGEGAQALRPDTPGNNELYKFDPADVVETHGSASGHFLIHFTKAGKNAVPAADDDASGVPDFVEEVAAVYDEAYQRYHIDLGFRTPVSDEAIPTDNGGDGRFDVYLVDFAGIGDGIFRTDGCSAENAEVCTGYMAQENDYAGYGYPSTTIANRILGSHEYFHAVQAAYDTGQGSVASEGTAVWATEKFDPSLEDFEGFLSGYMKNTDRTLTEPLPGPVDPFSYGAAIFFQFLDERYGAALVRSLWERCENGAGGEANPDWFTALDPMLKAEAGSSFAEAFVEFAEWNLFTAKSADPERGYADGADYPSVDFVDITLPFTDDALRVFRASAQYYRMSTDGRAKITAALVPPKDTPSEADGVAMLLVARTGTALGSVLQVVDPLAGVEVVDATGADKFIVVVVNTSQSGESQRPGLCIGTPEEVAACRAALVPVEEQPPVMNPPTTPPPPVDPQEDAGCDCGMSRPPSRGGLALLPIAAFLLARRRRAKRKVGHCCS
jgi:MYXO-CTERM domain-containing protein